MRLRWRRTRAERGAAAVEFALIAIPLLFLMAMIIQFSIWFWAYQVGGHAAREGARVAAVEPCTGGPATARATARVGSAANGPVAVGFSQTDSDGNVGLTVGDEVTVSVTYDVYSIALFSGLIPDVSKSATARVENIPTGGC